MMWQMYIMCVVQPDIRLVSLQGKAAPNGLRAQAQLYSYSYMYEIEVQFPQTTAQSSESCG